jgi:RNA polymerase sigma-70 factor (sigma-E family)
MDMAQLSTDGLSFVDFVRTTRQGLRHDAYLLCRDWDESDDLVQVALYALYRRWEALIRKDDLRAYTRKILLRVYLSERRRRRWSVELCLADFADGSHVAEPTSDTDPLTDGLGLRDALRRLGERQRAVIVLRFLDDLSVEQTAQLLGCSVGTVTSQTHRALQKLRNVLTDAGPEASRVST